MITIIDYDVGNIKNVYRAFENLGLDVVVSADKEAIKKSSAIILPGVGAFKDAMENLKKYDLVDCIKENAAGGKPILGICLGMQLLFEKSYEDGEWEGLGLLKGDIVKFSGDLKIPHMGWNKLIKAKEDSLSNDIREGEYVYFVHSYHLNPQNEDDVVFWTYYGKRIPAVVRQRNIIGMQFHPEKSGKTGIKLLRNIKEMMK